MIFVLIDFIEGMKTNVNCPDHKLVHMEESKLDLGAIVPLATWKLVQFDDSNLGADEGLDSPRHRLIIHTLLQDDILGVVNLGRR